MDRNASGSTHTFENTSRYEGTPLKNCLPPTPDCDDVPIICVADAFIVDVPTESTVVPKCDYGEDDERKGNLKMNKILALKDEFNGDDVAIDSSKERFAKCTDVHVLSNHESSSTAVKYVSQEVLCHQGNNLFPNYTTPSPGFGDNVIVSKNEILFTEISDEVRKIPTPDYVDVGCKSKFAFTKEDNYDAFEENVACTSDIVHSFNNIPFHIYVDEDSDIARENPFSDYGDNVIVRKNETVFTEISDEVRSIPTPDYVDEVNAGCKSKFGSTKEDDSGDFEDNVACTSDIVYSYNIITFSIYEDEDSDIAKENPSSHYDNDSTVWENNKENAEFLHTLSMYPKIELYNKKYRPRLETIEESPDEENDSIYVPLIFGDDESGHLQ